MPEEKRKRRYSRDELAMNIGIALSVGLTILAVIVILWTSPVRQASTDTSINPPITVTLDN